MFITIIYEDPHPLLHEVPGNVYYNSEYILPQDPYTREKFGLLESTAGLHPLLHEVSLYYIIPLLLYDYNDITFVVLLLSSLLLLYVYMYIHNNIYIYIYIYMYEGLHPLLHEVPGRPLRRAGRQRDGEGGDRGRK